MICLSVPRGDFICSLNLTPLVLGKLRGECGPPWVLGHPAQGPLSVGFFFQPATGLPICPNLGMSFLWALPTPATSWWIGGPEKTAADVLGHALYLG